MTTVQPLQTVATAAEKFALELANMLAVNNTEEAKKALKSYADQHNLTFGEASAIAGIASCMLHNKRWKKN